MSHQNAKFALLMVIVLCTTEALSFAIQRVFENEIGHIEAAVMHILLLASAASLTFYALINRSTRAATEQLQHINRHYKFAIDQHAIVATTDVKGIIQEVNDKFCEISGYEREELIGKDHRIINSGKRDKKYWRQMYRTVARGDIWKDEVMNRAKDGSYYWVDTTVIPVMNQYGKPTGYISIRTDITRQKQIQRAFEKTNEKLQKLSQLDDLTAIPNRRAYEKHFEIEKQNAQRSNQPLSMLILDIDNFKYINDNYGHDIGDDILRQVAKTIQQSLPRTTDFAARFGGEEFIVLLPTTNSEGAFQVAERIRKNILKITLPETRQKTDHQVTVSIGCANLPGYNLDKSELFRRADEAMYQAKNSGKNQSIAYPAHDNN